MLRNMLSFSKPEEETRKKINVNELLEGILLMMEKQMKEANVKVVTRFEPEIPGIMASTNQMRQVILNLFKNAKEAMPRGRHEGFDPDPRYRDRDPGGDTEQDF